jgi:hypothetical protein
MASSYDLLSGVGVAMSMVTTLYAAYWAFGIRRALAVRLYRNQGLGIGFLAIAVALTQINATISNYSANYPGFLTIIFPYFTTLTLFYWIDTSVQAGRRSDPLLRDTLHWKGLRVFLLAIIFVALLYDLVGFVSNASSVIYLIFFVPIVVPLAAGAIVLPVVGLRSKDVQLRRQLLWFGFFALSILAITIILANLVAPSLTSSITSLQTLLVQDVGVFIGGYCLYRSVRSLVPLNRISLEDTKEH